MKPKLQDTWAIVEKHAKIINKNYTKQTTIIKEENLFKKIKIKIKKSI